MRTFTHIFIFFTILSTVWPSSSLSAQEKKGKKEEGVTKYEMANAEYLLIEAQKFFLLEDYERAIAFLDQSLEIDAKNHAAYFKKAETYLVTEKYQQGLMAIQKAQELVSDNKYYYILAAQLHKAKNDLPAAARQYERMVANTQGYQEYLLDLVDVYVAIEDYDKAISTLDMTEKAFGTPDKYMLQKKDLLVQSGKTDEAISYLRRLLDQDNSNAALLQEYSALMTLGGKEGEVIAYLEDIATEVSNAQPLLITHYLRADQFDKATPLLQQALETGKINASQQLALANDLIRLEKAESIPLTRQLVEYMLERSPQNSRALEIQGELLTRMAISSEEVNTQALQSQAFEVLLKLKDSDPANLDNWKKILAYEYRNEDWQRLLVDAEASLDYFPNQGLFYFYFGSASIYSSDPNEASDLFSQATRLSFNNDSLKARTLGKIGELSFVQGQIEQGKEHFNQALGLLRHPDIANNYSLQLALRQIDQDLAQQLANELVREQPDQLKYIRTKAQVQFQWGSYGAARQILEEGLNRLTQQVDGPSLEQYGDILIKLDLVDEALTQWQKAKALGNTSEKLDQKIANKEYFK